MSIKLDAGKRKALYALAVAVGAAAIAFGLITDEQIALVATALPTLTALLAAMKTADPIVQVGKDGQPVAGDASELPTGTPVETTEAPVFDAPVSEELAQGDE